MNPDFKKYSDGLMPCIVQSSKDMRVLMLGFMNEESLSVTKSIGKVTFFSRSKNRLWTKGEESGNVLLVKEIKLDCDNDTLLIKAEPVGPTCHTGAETCFNETLQDFNFILYLESVIRSRINTNSNESYVSTLLKKGINKVAQKVGEEAVELVIESKDNNDDLFLNEAADLLFHYMILLQAKGRKFDDVLEVLRSRHK